MTDSTVEEPVLTVTELASFLSQAIGDAKAREVVRAAVLGMGLAEHAVTRAQALALFEKIATQDGIVGVAARFAKSRLHLRWA